MAIKMFVTNSKNNSTLTTRPKEQDMVKKFHVSTDTLQVQQHTLKLKSLKLVVSFLCPLSITNVYSFIYYFYNCT